ncbi:thioredoxin family protein [Tautonia sociabilis]|uniref:thioredoxin family protein n=1 Tax=Tautonia sociabilis TaxID=2080755 RepID=UPI0013150EC5|nr:thioredoxin family protein [Tautonia sociabilis]
MFRSSLALAVTVTVASLLALGEAARAQVPAPAPAAVQWRPDYHAALQEAAETGKPVFLDLGFEGCAPCHRMDVETFRDPNVVATLNRLFVPVRLDGTAPANAGLVRSLRVWGYPTLVILDPEGRVVTRTMGFLDAGQTQALLAKGIKGMRR